MDKAPAARDRGKAPRIVALRRLGEEELAALNEVGQVDYFEDLNEGNREAFEAAMASAHGLCVRVVIHNRVAHRMQQVRFTQARAAV